MACPKLDDVIEKFDSFAAKPVKFLSVQNEVKDDIKCLVKSLYDFTKTQDKDIKRPRKGALPELIVQDLDEEQIWQEIELQNNECWDQIVWEVANCMTLKNDLVFPVNADNKLGKQKKDDGKKNQQKETVEENLDGDQEEKDEVDDNEAAEGNHSDEEMLEDEEEIESPKKKILKPKNLKPSIVDDQFFKLQEMEEFLLKEEKGESSNKKKASEDSDEDSIDLFQDIEEEDDDDDDDEGDEEKERGTDVMYSDFFEQDNADERYHQNDDEMDEDEEMDDIENGSFDEPEHLKRDKKVRFAQPSSSDDDSDDNNIPEKSEKSDEKKSEFERRQDRLKETIDRLEKKNLNDAPWQLKGEVDATKRPQNSLLEEVIDFDLTTRPAPIITEQTTVTLEDLIRQRIKDKAWDDVVKKEKPVDDQLNFRKTEILDQSKSKLSLAQVYEAEYLKQKQAVSGDIEEEKEPESHKQIRESMSLVFAKLDALCHYHYTPKAAKAEVKIVSNTPAISMEEVAPVAVSDAALLAPEEVKKKQRGELMSKEERTQTDKNRERRKKKKLQRAKGPVNKVTEHRNTTKGTEANDKSLKTSKAFFQQLNDDATSIIKNSKNKNVKNGNKKG